MPKPEKPPAEKRACEDATGIAACESVDRYTEEGLKLAQGSMDPAERAQAFLELANGELARLDIPANKVGDPIEPGKAGKFVSSGWAMTVDPTLFTDEKMKDPTAVASALNTVYHEARHTEQLHRMAQLRRAQGLDPEAIAAELQIPLEVAREVEALPLEGGRDQKEAQAWWDSAYGDGREKRAMAVDFARRGFSMDLYCALPEEADAWTTGASVSERVPGGIDERHLERCGRAARP